MTDNESSEGRRFADLDLTGATFTSVDLTGASFTRVDLSSTRMRQVYLRGAVLRGAELVDVEISGEIERLVINGVDVAPLVDAEIDRQHPGYAKMKPADAQGFREAWDILEQRWADTVSRARTFAPEQLDERVDGEWSFNQTLRHLVFATDSWVRRAILGERAPWDVLDLPWEQMVYEPGYPVDLDARPSLEQVLALRQDRMRGVRDYLAGLDDQTLAGRTTPVDGPGWPPPEPFDVREVLLTVLNEEWWHRMFAERDLDALQARR